MGILKKLSLAVALLAVVLGYMIHSPIPAEVPDPMYYQLLVNTLSAAELAATISEWMGFNRWWSYPGNIDLPHPYSYPPGMEFDYVKLAGVESVIVTPSAFKARTEPGPALVFYHGGGWVFGNLLTYMPLLVQAAEETGFLVVSAEYRRAPQFPFPTPYEDCLNSTIDFMKRANEFNVDPTKIILSGDSAGGNLAMAITLDLLRKQEKDPSINKPEMTALIYPILQMVNFNLPSHLQNRKFVFSKSLIPKFWLTYIGFNDNLKLAEIVAENGHVSPAKKRVKEAMRIASAESVPEKYKRRSYNSTLNQLTNEQKSLLTESVRTRLQEGFLDTRIAPLVASNAELAKMPRTHIFVCEYDPLRDDGVILFERLKHLKRNVTLQYLPDSLHASATLGSVFLNTYHAEQNRIFFKTIENHFN